jgi:hypothetical protein
VIDKDLTEHNIIGECRGDSSQGEKTKNETRDSSTIRLRQMIAFQQFTSNNLGRKELKMMDKLKPYFNKFRITTHTESSNSTINKVDYEINFRLLSVKVRPEEQEKSKI